MEHKETLVKLMLSIQRALVGVVTPNLYAVTAGITNNTARIDAFFYGFVTEHDLESIQVAASEVASDLPEHINVEENCFSRQNTPAEVLDFWAFKREA